jgi:hypothetical protein
MGPPRAGASRARSEDGAIVKKSRQKRELKRGGDLGKEREGAATPFALAPGRTMGDKDCIIVTKASSSAGQAGRSDELCAAPEKAQPSASPDLEGRNESGETAFLIACGRGDVERMQLLAEAGCDTAAVDSEGVTALMYTTFYDTVAAVRAALAAGWCELEARDKDGDTAFLTACNVGSVDCMELLIEAGCDATVVNGEGGNALMHTVVSGVAAAVRAALGAGWRRETIGAARRS